MMAGIVASNVIIVSFRHSYCPPEMLGCITATTLFLNFGTIPIGALLGGDMVAPLGIRPTMWLVCLGIWATSGLLLAAPLRRVRDLPLSWAPGSVRSGRGRARRDSQR